MSRRKRQDKAITLRRHFKNRLLERYGIQATNEDIKKYVQMIQEGRGRIVMKQSLRVSVWDLFINEKTLRVAYDKNRKELITALPPDVPVDWGTE
jgi:hypothetical protein